MHYYKHPNHLPVMCIVQLSIWIVVDQQAVCMQNCLLGLVALWLNHKKLVPVFITHQDTSNYKSIRNNSSTASNKVIFPAGICYSVISYEGKATTISRTVFEERYLCKNIFLCCISLCKSFLQMYLFDTRSQEALIVLLLALIEEESYFVQHSGCNYVMTFLHLPVSTEDLI